MDTQFKHTILVKSDLNKYYLVSWYNTKFTSKIRFISVEDEYIGDSRTYNIPFRRIIYSDIVHKLKTKNLSSYRMRRYRELQTDTSWEAEQNKRKYLRKYQNWKSASRFRINRGELPDLKPPTIEIRPKINAVLSRIGLQEGRIFQLIDIEKYLQENPQSPFHEILAISLLDINKDTEDKEIEQEHYYDKIDSLLKSELIQQNREFNLRLKFGNLDNLVKRYTDRSSYDKDRLQNFLHNFNKVVFALSNELEAVGTLPENFDEVVTKVLNHQKLSYKGASKFQILANNKQLIIEVKEEIAKFYEPSSRNLGYHRYGESKPNPLKVKQDNYLNTVNIFWGSDKLRNTTREDLENHIRQDLLSKYLNPVSGRVLRAIIRYLKYIEKEFNLIIKIDKNTENLEIIELQNDIILATLMEKGVSTKDKIFFYVDEERIDTSKNYTVIKLKEFDKEIEISNSNIFPGQKISFEYLNYLTTIYQNCILIIEDELEIEELTIYLDLGFHLYANFPDKYQLHRIVNTDYTISEGVPFQLLVEPDMRQRRLIFASYWNDGTQFNRLKTLLLNGMIRNGEILGTVLYNQARNHKEDLTEFIEKLYVIEWLVHLKWNNGIERQMIAYLSKYGSEETKKKIQKQKVKKYEQIVQKLRTIPRFTTNTDHPLNFLVDRYEPTAKVWWDVVDTIYECNGHLFLKIREVGASYPRDVNYGKIIRTTPNTSMIKPTLKRGELGKYPDLYALGVIFSIIDPSTKRSYLVRRINKFVETLSDNHQEFFMKVIFNLYLANVPHLFITNLLNRFTNVPRTDLLIWYSLQSPHFSQYYGIYYGNNQFVQGLRDEIAKLNFEEVFILAYKEERNYSFNDHKKGSGRRYRKITKGRSDYQGIVKFKEVRAGNIRKNRSNFVVGKAKEYFNEIIDSISKNELELVFGKYPDKFLLFYTEDYEIESARFFNDLLVADLTGDIEFIKQLEKTWKTKSKVFKEEVINFLAEYYTSNNCFSGLDPKTNIVPHRYHRRRRRNRLQSDYFKLTPFFLSTPPEFLEQLITIKNDTWKLFYMFFNHRDSILPRYPFIYYYLQLPLTNLLKIEAEEIFQADYERSDPKEKISLIFNYVRHVPSKWPKIFELQDLEVKQRELCSLMLEKYQDTSGIDEINNFIGNQLLYLDADERKELLKNFTVPKATGYMSCIIKFQNYRDLIGFDELNYYLSTDNSLLIRYMIDVVKRDVIKDELELLIACVKSQNNELQEIARVKLKDCDKNELITTLSLDPHPNLLQYCIELYDQLGENKIEILLQLLEHPEAINFAFLLLELIENVSELSSESIPIVISFLTKILFVPMHDRMLKSVAIDNLVEIAVYHQKSSDAIVKLLTNFTRSTNHVDKQAAVLGIAEILEA